MRIKFLIPKAIRIKRHQFQVKKKFDVKLFKGAIAPGSQFEGKNTLRTNASLTNSTIGYGSYISENSRLSRIIIGKYSCIGSDVRNRFGQHPADTIVSIHPAFFSKAGQAGFTYTKKQLFEEHKYVDKNKKLFNRIGNDVWIGSNVLLMEGVEIADGAIVAAGSVVTKNVTPYTIVGGIPAKQIKKRFTEDQIDWLLTFKWWDKDLSWIKQHAEYFSNIDSLINLHTDSKS